MIRKFGLLTTLLICSLLLNGCNNTTKIHTDITDNINNENTENNNEKIICADIYDPICGVDGNVYKNGCYLTLAGVLRDKDSGVKNNECFKLTKEALYGKYILVRYNDNHNVKDNYNIELTFSEDGIFAKFCNSIGAYVHSLSGDILNVGETIKTEMLCEGESGEWLMNAENEFNLDNANVEISEDKMIINTSKSTQYEFEKIHSTNNDFSIPNFEELNDIVEMCPYEAMGGGYDEYPVYKRQFIIPYKDGYIGYEYGGNGGGRDYVLTYKSLDNPCQTISGSPDIFYRHSHYISDKEKLNYDEYPDNKLYYALWGGIPIDKIAKDLNCILGKDLMDDDTCKKEVDKFMYNLIIGNENDEYFQKWLDKLKIDIDNDSFMTRKTWQDYKEKCYEKFKFEDILNEYGKINSQLSDESRKYYIKLHNDRLHDCKMRFLEI